MGYRLIAVVLSLVWLTSTASAQAIKVDTAKAGGGLLGSGFGGRSTAHSALSGIDDATLQAITDQAYADFQAQAAAQGITLLDRAPLLADKGFAGTTVHPAPYEDNPDGGLFGSGQTLRYFVPTGFDGVRFFMGDIVGTAGGFGFSNPEMAAEKYADANKVKIVHVLYVVDFANAEKYGGFARSWSTVNVGAGIALPSSQNMLAISGGYGGTFSTNIGNMRLDEAIGSNVDFADVTDSTSDTSAAVQGAANVLGILAGTGTNSSRDYTFNARPDAYREGAIEVLGKANAAFLSKMAALR